MCSRGRVAVSDGDRSSATTTAGVGSSDSSTGRPARRRAILSATSITSAPRAERIGSSSAASWAATAAPAAWIAATPSSPSSAIRAAAASMSVGSQAIAAWAMKIAASSSCPAAPTRSDSAIRSSAATFAASRRRAISASCAPGATRPPAGSSRRRTWTHAPRATPGAAGTPVSRPGSVIAIRPYLLARPARTRAADGSHCPARARRAQPSHEAREQLVREQAAGGRQADTRGRPGRRSRPRAPPPGPRPGAARAARLARRRAAGRRQGAGRGSPPPSQPRPRPRARRRRAGARANHRPPATAPGGSRRAGARSSAGRRRRTRARPGPPPRTGGAASRRGCGGSRGRAVPSSRSRSRGTRQRRGGPRPASTGSRRVVVLLPNGGLAPAPRARPCRQVVAERSRQALLVRVVEGEGVRRHVVDPQGDRRVQRGAPGVDGLARHVVQQVDRDRGDSRVARLAHGVGDVGRPVAPPEAAEQARLERLRAQRQPVDARRDERPGCRHARRGPGWIRS